MLPGSIHPSGEPVEWDRNIDHTPATINPLELQGHVLSLAATTLLARNWPEHNRHWRTLHLCGGLLSGGWSLERVVSFLRLVCMAANDQDFLDRKAAAESTFAKMQSGEPITGWTALADELDSATVRRLREWLGITSSAAYERNDRGNAQRYIIANLEKIRYCPEPEKWYFWDNGCWHIDNTGRANFLVGNGLDIIKEEQRASVGDAAEALGKWYSASCSSAHMASMVRWAKHDRSIHIPSSMLDIDPWLLACKNGTINLKTGGLQPPSRDDYITKITNATYDPEAQSDEWDRFLNDITEGNQDLQKFLQRLCGYMATGFTHEDKFVIAGDLPELENPPLCQPSTRYWGIMLVRLDLKSFDPESRRYP